jgi:hypothetical protein
VLLPKVLTTHKLRHAFASILVALGESRPVELGEYEAPIVRALAGRGGRAHRREIVAAVGRRWPSATARPIWRRCRAGPPRLKPWVARFRGGLYRVVGLSPVVAGVNGS